MQVQAYLFFNGRCEEAVEFYRRALGAELKMLLRYSESPDPHQPGVVAPEAENNVMHCSFCIGETTVNASDGHSLGGPDFKGFSLSLTVPDDASADRYFTALSDGGQVRMPLAKTFFSSRFGMLVDRFGVAWMIYVVK